MVRRRGCAWVRLGMLGWASSLLSGRLRFKPVQAGLTLRGRRVLARMIRQARCCMQLPAAVAAKVSAGEISLEDAPANAPEIDLRVNPFKSSVIAPISR